MSDTSSKKQTTKNSNKNNNRMLKNPVLNIGYKGKHYFIIIYSSKPSRYCP
jgi:hypothetical protein